MPSASALEPADEWPRGRLCATGDKRWTLSGMPPVPNCVPYVRQQARAVLRLWGLTEVASEVELLLTELVTNVVKHARTTFDVVMTWSGWQLRCEVSDGSPHPARPQLTPSPERTGGRGFLLVNALSSGWGVDMHDQGKSVWFTTGLSRSPDDERHLGD